MEPLVQKLQADLLDARKTVTEILRTAKLIAGELALEDVAKWIDCELNGYQADRDELPPYRKIAGGMLQIQNPYYGWREVGSMIMGFPVWDRISYIESLSSEGTVMLPLPRRFPVPSLSGLDAVANTYPRRVAFAPAHLKQIPEAVKDKLLDWSIDVRKHIGSGAKMIAGEGQKQIDGKRIFEMPSPGDTTETPPSSTGNPLPPRASQKEASPPPAPAPGSVIRIDYSAIHPELKRMGVPQKERNELENIMDELNFATPAQRRTLYERADVWVLRNERYLGDGASMVRDAIGI